MDNSKPLSKKEKKELTHKSAFEDKDFIIVRKDDFQRGMCTLLYYAWKYRNSESHLYALYNYIQSLQSFTLRSKIGPCRVVAPWPQPLFGTLESPQGEANYPHRSNALPSNFIPDHARIIIFGSHEQGPSYSLQDRISVAFDSSEVKVLNIKTPWNLPESQPNGDKMARSHVAQVCESSLAGLAHNPFWTSLYAFLLVGPYFSLFAWKTRPDAAHLEPLPALPDVPRPDTLEKEALQALITERDEVLQQRIQRIKNTPLPEVIYYNEPVFVFAPEKGKQKWYDKASLSLKYLHALSLPTSASEELQSQPSWFSVAGESNRFDENNKRVNVSQDVGRECIQMMVINARLQDESSTANVVSEQPDLTRTGPRPPDSSDSQQSRFSETEPQVVDPDAGPHQMKTRASTVGVDDIIFEALE